MIASALSLALLLAPAVHPTAPARQDTEQPPAIQVQGDNYILNFADVTRGGDEGGMSLAAFVAACQQVTKHNFHYSEETASFLDKQKVRLLGTKVIPKDKFYSFFQIIMIMNQFVCTEIGPKGISVIQIDNLNTGNRTTLRSNSVLVDPENLQEYAAQPATLITTVINLPNTDVRQLSNSMRTMITDANTQQMLPAGATSAMVLTGFGSNVVALARMLRIVDDASRLVPVEPEFAKIELQYAAADEIASIVEELLDARRRASQTNNRGAGQNQGVSAALPQGQTESKIMVDPRTNALIVMAMPESMPQIKELIAQLDVDVVERERSYHIYNLENVKAEDLAETLTEFLQETSRLEQATTGQGNGQQRARGGNSSEFVVVPDPETNSLLIAASRTRYEELRAMITRLDRRQDQVLIETALIELSGRDFLDIGVDLGLADVPGLGALGGFGVTNFGLSTLEDMDLDGVPESLIPIRQSGITAGILSGDDFSLPVLLRLIEEKRNSNVLNVPSVLVNNNGSALVEAIEEQPTTTITANGGVSGQTQENFNDYVEAGISMRISPSISASRYLRLEVFLEVSNFLGAVQGAIPPARTTRTIETTVNVPDGDTMVIGGIILDNHNKTRSQVPFLGDLPIIGGLFRRTSDTLDRTALYFFVTPHILHDADFADLAELSYIKKMEAADTIGLERMRAIDKNFGGQQGRIDLQGLSIPLYSAPERGETGASDLGLDELEVQAALSSQAKTESEEN
ncbi:MAG: general secretion pathway protein D [Planctomycetota bacterium]|jgi:general secretion pathway protein D